MAIRRQSQVCCIACYIYTCQFPGGLAIGKIIVTIIGMIDPALRRQMCRLSSPPCPSLSCHTQHAHALQGFSRGSSSYRGVTAHPSGRWESRIGIRGSRFGRRLYAHSLSTTFSL